MTSSTKPFEPPKHTQFSNDAIDQIMREVSPNAWKIITVAIRKTYGWHKQSDVISLSQFQELTGIGSRSTVVKAIREVVENGILLKREKGDSFEYELNRDYVVQKSNQSNNCTNTSPENGLAGSPENGHTKEIHLNKKETITPNGVSAPEKTYKKQKPDLLDGILHYEKIGEEKEREGKSWTHRDKFPEPFLENLDAYVSLTGQKPIKKNVSDWLMTAQDWHDLGVKPADIQKAYEKANPENGEGFTVARPGSLTYTAGMFAGKRKVEVKQSKPKIYKREAKKSVPNPLRR